MSEPLLVREGIDELKRKIAQFPELALTAAEPAMRDALIYLHGRIPAYPSNPAPGTASKFWTAKQRRWFWWQVRKLGNTALFNYRRTGTLGRKITERVTRSTTEVEGELGMNTPYASMVIGRGTQAPMHQGHWWVFEDVIDANAPGALDEFADTFLDEFEDAYAAR